MSSKLEGQQRKDALEQLERTGWKVTDHRDAITKSFVLTDFNQAFGFMTRVALLAEKLNHHPEWFNVYNQVDVTLSTHDLNGLSTFDSQMAHFMDQCVAEL